MNHKSKSHKFIAIFILIVLIAAIGCGVNNYLQRNYFYPLKYYDVVCTQAEKYDCDPLLIMAIIKAESNFKTDAVSHKDAVGLMQITPATAQWAAEKMELEEYSTEKLSSPETNIAIGVWYLDYLLAYYQDNTQLALAAYNAGIGNVDKWLANEQIIENGNVLTLPYKETSKYLVNINAYYERYKQLYANELHK